MVGERGPLRSALRPTRTRLIVLVAAAALVATSVTLTSEVDGHPTASAAAAGTATANASTAAADAATAGGTAVTATTATPTSAAASGTGDSATAGDTSASSPTVTEAPEGAGGSASKKTTGNTSSTQASSTQVSATASATATPTTSTTAAQRAAAEKAVDAARAYGQSRGEQTVVAVLDRDTGVRYTSGDLSQQFQSASVVKVFIAAELLLTGQMSDPDVEATAYQMITQSDDDDADALYYKVGGDQLTTEIEKDYDLTGLAPPPVAGSWGSTYITAGAMLEFYDKIADQPTVGPWLENAMAHAQQIAADGTNQYFGLPSVASDWKVKQGWVCCEVGVSGVNSTGYLDGTRFVAVILTQGTPSQYLTYETDTITEMARRLLPEGTFPTA